MKQTKVVQETPELDLMELLAKCISFLKKYARLIAVFFMAGILAGVAIYQVLPKIYTSSMILQPALLTNAEQINTINSWNGILKERQYEELARRFNTSPTVISKVKSITAEDAASHGPSSGTNNFTAFSVQLKVTDPSVFPTIQKGILYALENGDYVREKLAAQKSNYKALIQVTTQELNRLDSMRSAIERTLVAPRQATGSVIMDVSDLNRTTVALHTRLLQLKDSLNFAEAAHILQHFYTPNRHNEPKLFKIVGMGAAAGLIIGFIVAFYLFVMQHIRSGNQASDQSTPAVQQVTPSGWKQPQPH
jgi:hypothetical protein